MLEILASALMIATRSDSAWTPPEDAPRAPGKRPTARQTANRYFWHGRRWHSADPFEY